MSRAQILERPPTGALGLRSQPSALGVGEPPAGAELLPEETVLFLEIVDDVALRLVDSAGERDDEKLQGVRKWRHTGRA